MASTLKINTLTGVSTAGSIAVTGEGNSTTTNLQQGLAKAWVNFNGASVDSNADLTGVRDSLNIASVVDNGTGDYTYSFTNAMSSGEYSPTFGSERLENNNSFNHMGFETTNSTSFIQNHWNSGLSVDDPFRTYNQVNGDLA